MTDSAQHRSVRTVGQTQPLRGIVVVSLEQAVAAPLATRHLADLGATVIKVERPGGDFARAYDATVAGTSAYFAWANRGKQSLVLDLKEAGDRTAFDELLAAADVFVHNVSPRAARGLGIDVATLSERFPELITADVCGYGEGGPRSDEKAYDLAIQAEVGVFAVTGGDDMSKVGFSVADISAGMYAYAGILAALVGRSLTGTASHVPVSMLDSLTEWMAAPLYGAVYGGGRPPRTGHRHHAIAPYGCFALAEGETVLIAVQNEREWQRLATDVLVAKLLHDFGTDEQRERYLPRMATGELRATMALTEPSGGSDLQAMRTVARPAEGGYRLKGSKTWISNARRSGLLAVLCKTDPEATPAHKGVSILLVEHGDGLTVSKDLPKLGYKGVESCELVFDDMFVPAAALLGVEEGRGFSQMMRGLEIGRLQVAARALGVGQAALDDALRYAQEREAFGKPIWKHQSIGNYLADMATTLEAARQLTLYAARAYDEGRRSDMEAGMAKLFASETAMEIALNAVRIHGGYGYSTEYDVERYFRDAPLMIVGEGTNEIQKNVIVKQLVERNRVRR